MTKHEPGPAIVDLPEPVWIAGKNGESARLFRFEIR